MIIEIFLIAFPLIWGFCGRFLPKIFCKSKLDRYTNAKNRSKLSPP